MEQSVLFAETTNVTVAMQNSECRVTHRSARPGEFASEWDNYKRNAQFEMNNGGEPSLFNTVSSSQREITVFDTTASISSTKGASRNNRIEPETNLLGIVAMNAGQPCSC